MGLLNKPRASRRIRGRRVAIRCAFCRRIVPAPRTRRDVFSGEGCLGGRCECSAVFVVDETGKDGGQALLDAQALACDGDLDRALELADGTDYEVRTHGLGPDAQDRPGRAVASGYLPPKVWFLKLTG